MAGYSGATINLPAPLSGLPCRPSTLVPVAIDILSLHHRPSSGSGVSCLHLNMCPAPRLGLVRRDLRVALARKQPQQSKNCRRLYHSEQSQESLPELPNALFRWLREQFDEKLGQYFFPK